MKQEKDNILPVSGGGEGEKSLDGIVFLENVRVARESEEKNYYVGIWSFFFVGEDEYGAANTTELVEAWPKTIVFLGNSVNNFQRIVSHLVFHLTLFFSDLLLK